MLAQRITQSLQGHPELELAILFGSQATGRARLDSDVDVAVLAARPLDTAQKMSLITDIAEATGLSVDLVDIRTAGEPLLGQVMTHGQRLIGSAETQSHWLCRHLVDAEDFMPYVRRMLAERRKAWTGT